MTCPVNEKVQEQELMIEALQGIKSGPYKSHNHAAKVLGIKVSTFYHRTSGRPPTRQRSDNLEFQPSLENQALIGSSADTSELRVTNVVICQLTDDRNAPLIYLHALTFVEWRKQ